MLEGETLAGPAAFQDLQNPCAGFYWSDHIVDQAHSSRRIGTRFHFNALANLVAGTVGVIGYCNLATMNKFYASLRTHHVEACGWPGNEEVWLDGATTKRNVGEAYGFSQNHCDQGYRRADDGI